MEEKRTKSTWKEWEGKHVFLRLKQGREYSGTISEVDENAKPIGFITLIDRYNKKVVFAISEIKFIQEEEGE